MSALPWVVGFGTLIVLIARAGSAKGSSGAAVFESGRASWYGPGYQGKPTASGEPFDRHKFTAAHKTLRHGTMVEVTDKATGNSVVVRINDRGPFVAGRIIDLAEAAAAELDIIDRGVVDVDIRIVG